MSVVADQKFKVGDVVIDPLANIAVIGGKEKRVEPKLIALLTYLAQHSKEVVTRQQITEAIWPNVIVADESVTQAIFALRNLLGDDAKQPQYIETIPKKGYRFLADVGPLDIKTLEADTSQQSPKNKLPLVQIIFVAVLTIAFILMWFVFWKTSDEKIVNILPASKMEGVEGDMAINLKHQMVFIHYTPDGSGLYLKDLKTGTQERITEPQWYITPQPVWIDDNTLLYSRCSLDRACQIVRQQLHELPEVLYASNNGIVEAIIRPDQTDEIFFSEADPDKEDIALFNIRTAKYELLRERYSDLPKHISHPQFSKDGEKLYFVYKFEKVKLMVLDLSNGKVKTLSEQFEELHSISFNHQQELMIAGNINSVPGLWFLNPNGGELKLFLRSVSGEMYVRAAAAPDEHAIYCQTVSLNIDNIIFDMGRDITSELPNLNSTGLDKGAIFSHNEQFIYFVSNRSGFQEIWRYDLAKKTDKQITRIKTPLLEYLSLSHNGQHIAAIYMDKSQWVTGIFSVFTGELLAQKPAKFIPLNWSNDDESIYVVDIKNNEKKLLRMNSQTLDITEVQDRAGLYAEEFDDGKSLIFYDFDKNNFVKRNLISGDDKPLTGAINQTQLDYHVHRIDTKNESLLTVYHDQQTYQLRQYLLNATTENSPNILFNMRPETEQLTYINNTGAKVLINRVIAAEGDMLKLELEH